MSSEQETKPTKDTQKEEQGKVIKMKPIEVKPQAEKLTADGQKILPYITLNIVPVAKPRMTQSDKWKKKTRYYKVLAIQRKFKTTMFYLQMATKGGFRYSVCNSYAYFLEWKEKRKI